MFSVFRVCCSLFALRCVLTFVLFWFVIVAVVVVVVVIGADIFSSFVLQGLIVFLAFGLTRDNVLLWKDFINVHLRRRNYQSINERLVSYE